MNKEGDKTQSHSPLHMKTLRIQIILSFGWVKVKLFLLILNMEAD